MYSYRTVEEEVEDVEDGGVDDDDDRDTRNALAEDDPAARTVTARR
jgi:hypothetical protein